MAHGAAPQRSDQRDHLLQTPDTFVRAPLPGMRNATAIVHAGPAMGAGFTQYTVELERGGGFQLGQAQSFVYVIDGLVNCAENKGAENRLPAGHYAWLPPDRAAHVTASEPARVTVIEKPHSRSEER